MKFPTEAPSPSTPRELQKVIFAEREGHPFMLYRRPEGAFILEQLESSRRFSVGRNNANDLVLDFDVAVSGVHAEILQLGGEWVIEDDGLSSNGTFVNGTRLGGQQRLKDGDSIRVGDTTLIFRQPAAASSPRDGAFTTQPPADSARVDVTPRQRAVLVELCRPMFTGRSTNPASNQQVADALFVSVETVKSHLKSLYTAFGLGEDPAPLKRAMLADRARETGAITARDYA